MIPNHRTDTLYSVRRTLAFNTPYISDYWLCKHIHGMVVHELKLLKFNDIGLGIPGVPLD